MNASIVKENNLTVHKVDHNVDSIKIIAQDH